MILLLAGLFADVAVALDNAISVRLDAQSNSGQTGTAILTPEGDKTRVVIELSNVPAGLAQPAHIHRGSCDALDKAPKWSLKAVTDGRSVTVIPVSLSALLKERMAINIHKSAIETQIYIACGNIRRR
jgi:hypothetical protein